MQGMADILTKLALLGAAVSFALYLSLRYTRQIADFADMLAKIRRFHQTTGRRFAAARLRVLDVRAAGAFVLA